MAETWVEWAPHWAPNVSGRYTERVWNKGDRMHEEQRIEAKCSTCGATWKGACLTGHVRNHIVTFARVHIHDDKFAPARKP